MYKVFVNDKPIIITSSLKNENKYAVYPFKHILFEEILHKLKFDAIKGIVLYSTDLEKDWTNFKHHLDVIPAAGGLVTNAQQEILFIYRNNVWDLPKGKIEKGESTATAAIREVEEECGIFNLKLGKKLCITYHIYNQDGLKLKETHWYFMSSKYTGALSPQLEEGITKVCFKNEQEISDALQNTYANIKLVYDIYKET
ncbi:NUDIX hydrolase [Polaribacter sp. M15]